MCFPPSNPNALKTRRQSKCKVCRAPFVKLSISHKVCGTDCALELSRREREKKLQKAARQQKVKLRSRRDWLKLAQVEFNKFIRARDAKDPCISCQRHHSGQYHAGHYMSTGAKPELRFDEANCHKQCSACNNHLSGNIAAYRINLIRKVGQGEVDRLEGPTEPGKWTIEQLTEIRDRYWAKTKELT